MTKQAGRAKWDYIEPSSWSRVGRAKSTKTKSDEPSGMRRVGRDNQVKQTRPRQAG